MAGGSKWMSGSANRRNHRREAPPRAEDSAICVLRAPPGAPGESFFLLTSTYHGGRPSGQNPMSAATLVPRCWLRSADVLAQLDLGCIDLNWNYVRGGNGSAKLSSCPS